MSYKTKNQIGSPVLRFRAKDLQKRITTLAKKKGVTPSHILRQATIEYMERQEQPLV
jgi:predicted transcriptional regulator